MSTDIEGGGRFRRFDIRWLAVAAIGIAVACASFTAVVLVVFLGVWSNQRADRKVIERISRSPCANLTIDRCVDKLDRARARREIAALAAGLDRYAKGGTRRRRDGRPLVPAPSPTGAPLGRLQPSPPTRRPPAAGPTPSPPRGAPSPSPHVPPPRRPPGQPPPTPVIQPPHLPLPQLPPLPHLDLPPLPPIPRRP
jgi:hypothetical protein